MLAVMNKKWISRWFIALILLISTHRIELNSQYTAIPEKPIVIIVPSYNNRDWYKKNLDSLLNQHYSNYRIIYIADCPTDGTDQLVAKYLKTHDSNHRVRLICNAKRCGALANIYHAIHSCKDHEIAVVCDGDDWFKHERVLQKINEAYADPNVWMTYGQFERYPYGSTGYCKDFPSTIIEHNAYREYDWISSHVRTCYVKLFKKIKLQDLIENGDFFDVTGDQAVMFPLLEMAHGNHKCIKDVLYVYNSASPINDYKIKLLRQMHYEKVIRGKNKYEKVIKLFDEEAKSFPDVLMFSENNPAYAYAFLETLSKYCNSLGNVTLLYRADSISLQHSYETLSTEFLGVKLIHCTKNNFSQSLHNILQEVASPYIALARDGVVIKDFITIAHCASVLENTGAYGFYCALGNNIQENPMLARAQKVPLACSVEEGVCGYQFKQGEGDWRKAHSIAMTIYRTNDIKESLLSLKATCVRDLELAWESLPIDGDAVGIFCDESKVVLMHTDAQDYATKMFNEGMKIDAVPLFKIANVTIDIGYNGMFVTR